MLKPRRIKVKGDKLCQASRVADRRMKMAVKYSKKKAKNLK